LKITHHFMSQKGVLLVNLGTPDSPSVPHVRKYLREFLLDPRVIDINAIGRFLLVNLIIAPFRAPKSAKIYKELWTERGSPLLFYGIEVRDLLQKELGNQYDVQLAMRYQSPSIKKALDYFEKKNYKDLIVIPMFPQYASASTGSAHEEVMRLLCKQQIFPNLEFITNYFDHPLFIQAFATLAKQYLDKENYDHVLFSYHGLPERQIKKGDCTNTCLQSNHCCSSIHQMNYFCYRAQCFETTRLIAKELHLEENQYSVCFQSRLGRDPWIKPYADDIIKKLPSEGKKKVLTLVPSFTSDCLETIIEVGEEYKELFEHNGGERWQMVESLNTHPIWIKTLKQLVLKNEMV
jgi:protoporphyrin/coproporphyrin ferrochelatase